VSLTGGAGEASGASGLSAAAPSSCSVVPPSSRSGVSTWRLNRAVPPGGSGPVVVPARRVTADP